MYFSSACTRDKISAFPGLYEKRTVINAVVKYHKHSFDGILDILNVMTNGKGNVKIGEPNNYGEPNIFEVPILNPPLLNRALKL